jgi:hypothetical protein
MVPGIPLFISDVCGARAGQEARSTAIIIAQILSPLITKVTI